MGTEIRLSLRENFGRAQARQEKKKGRNSRKECPGPLRN
jgi:hypothetical protein